MAGRFKYMKGCNKNYDRQGEIYFTCRNYRRQPERVRQRIRELCEQAAGEHAAALLEFLTSDADWIYVCDHHFISSSTLARARLKFYDLWP